MTVSQIIEMLERRVAYLSQLRASAAALGDIARAASLDEDLAETELTLATLLAANN
ncbi:MAG: hypothetical protein ACOVP3_03575 [Rhodoluna sp.]